VITEDTNKKLTSESETDPTLLPSLHLQTPPTQSWFWWFWWFWWVQAADGCCVHVNMFSSRSLFGVPAQK